MEDAKVLATSHPSSQSSSKAPAIRVKRATKQHPSAVRNSGPESRPPSFSSTEPSGKKKPLRPANDVDSENDDQRQGRSQVPMKSALATRQVAGVVPRPKDPWDDICDQCLKVNQRRKKGRMEVCDKKEGWDACIRCHVAHMGCSLTSAAIAFRAAQMNEEEIRTGKHPARSRSRSTSRPRGPRQRSQSRGRTPARKGEGIFLLVSLTF